MALNVGLDVSFDNCKTGKEYERLKEITDKALLWLLLVSGDRGQLSWALLCRCHLKTEKRCVFKKYRMMDDVENCDSYTNIPSSQTYI
jgi:hypothetical protein